ncbi:CLUMA_CG000298, isoform A [Clunio marinus]|uniref:CLUMA_CG000298, isoform A n=1 Tax=Clunio marinus TaxID=568069 RepID=A0A1J1HFF9_9DIPT|nr:CLUMA_CG000298, isoform A [Clunio marinus]
MLGTYSVLPTQYTQIFTSAALKSSRISNAIFVRDYLQMKAIARGVTVDTKHMLFIIEETPPDLICKSVLLLCRQKSNAF